MARILWTTGTPYELHRDGRKGGALPTVRVGAAQVGSVEVTGSDLFIVTSLVILPVTGAWIGVHYLGATLGAMLGGSLGIMAGMGLGLTALRYHYAPPEAP